MREWHIDIVRYLSGHRLVVVEIGTGLVASVELDNPQSTASARLALTEIIRRWRRYPDYIVTDNGRSLSGVGERIGVEQRYYSGLTPSLVERYVRRSVP